MTERRMQLEDWLDDLCVRFLMNGPKEDLETAERICFRVEEAQWYYEDFIRPLDPALPSMSLRRFCEQMFAHCPLLSPFSQGEHMAAFEAFILYKARIPVRGAIMLNETMDQVVLVKGWKKGANWSFPRGKINKDEDDLDCAVREVYEETGYDIESAGLIPENRNVKFIELSMHEQQIRLFVFRDVPMDTHFEPRTRKEISKIEWWNISDLPAFKRKGQQQPSTFKANNFYMVAPFLGPLRKWVLDQKKMDAKRTTSNPYLSAGLSHEEVCTEEDQGADSNAKGFYAEPPNSIPDVDELASATANLNRMLKISQQAPEEAPMVPPSTKNTGSALFALLQSKPAFVNHLPTPAPPPETPFDPLDYGEAPMPPTPYHEHPRPPHFSEMPPAPRFPTLQSRERDFSYDQPFLHTNTRENMESKFMQAQEHMKKRAMQRAQENARHQQPLHLIHPQPLPPHVQRAVFNGGAVPAPAMPQPIQQQPQPQYNSTISMPPGIPQFPGLHAPMVSQVQHQSPPKLTSHSLALLNAFKNSDGTSGGSTEPKAPLQRFEQENAPVQHHDFRYQHQEVPNQRREAPVHRQEAASYQRQGYPQQYQDPPIQHREVSVPHREPPVQRHQSPAHGHESPVHGPKALPGFSAQYQANRQQHTQPQLSSHQYSQVSPREAKEKSPEDLLKQFQTASAQQFQRQPSQLLKEVSEAPEALHSQRLPPNPNGQQTISPGMMSGPRQPPSEQHKSALLGLFKAPPGQETQAARAPSSSAVPMTPIPSAVELSAVEPLSRHAAKTSALLNNKRTPEHSDKKIIPRMNPETNLPFRATSILSRPVEMNDPAQEPSQPRKIVPHRNSPQTNGRQSANGPSGQAQPKNLPVFQPQILKRPSPASNAPEPSMTQRNSPRDYVTLPIKTSPEYRPAPQPRAAPAPQASQDQAFLDYHPATVPQPSQEYRQSPEYYPAQAPQLSQEYRQSPDYHAAQAPQLSQEYRQSPEYHTAPAPRPHIEYRHVPAPQSMSEYRESPEHRSAAAPQPHPEYRQSPEHRHVPVPQPMPEYRASPEHHSALAPQPTSGYRPAPAPAPPVDHRKNLLSLFGKTQGEAPPSAFNAADRSRFGNLASGDEPARRGSQAPISPANKDFLLGYLDAVAKGGR